MANNSSLPTFLECGYNWTGNVAGYDAPLSTDSQIAGYMCCILASLLFGSNFVPFKFINTKDGFFCQWVMCAGIWLVGLVVQLIREEPHFFPWTLLGGAIWCLGNCCTVPIINLIGLSIGMLIWNCSNVLLGWATSRFGLLGLCAEVPSSEVLNYLGVVCCVGAGCVYVFVKTETTVTLPRCLQPKTRPAATPDLTIGTTEFDHNPNLNTSDSAAELLENSQKEESVFLPNLSPVTRRILGIVLSLAAGCCYGIQFLPATYIQNHETLNANTRASQNGLDYVFSQFSGIFMTSTVAFAGYLAFNRKTAFVQANIVLPSLLVGIVWGIATCCFFLANSTLSPAITFPIIATVPGMIATLWGIFLFQEIKGARNFMILGVAFSLTIAGAIMTALSK